MGMCRNMPGGWGCSVGVCGGWGWSIGVCGEWACAETCQVGGAGG